MEGPRLLLKRTLDSTHLTMPTKTHLPTDHLILGAGMHTIAVKAVDNEGLESLETVQLKVNGVVKKL